MPFPQSLNGVRAYNQPPLSRKKIQICSLSSVYSADMLPPICSTRLLSLIHI